MATLPFQKLKIWVSLICDPKMGKIGVNRRSTQVSKETPMKTGHWHRQTTITGLCLLLTLGTQAVLATASLAQFASPPGQGRPKGTAGGGSRPIHPFCLGNPNQQEVPIALAPDQSVALTSQARPTVWVYLPETKATMLEFSLFTQEREGVYQTNLPITGAGLVKITLPSTVAALQAGQSYYWVASLVCDVKRRTRDWAIGGWIQYQPLPSALQRQLQAATDSQQVKQYAQSNFWYDALTRYLELRQQQPDHAELGQLWTDLVTAGKLGSPDLPHSLPMAASSPLLP